MSERLRAVVDQLAIHPNDASLEELDLGARRFDKIFAVRVGLFHREPERAQELARRWLAPGGAVFAFFDSPAAAS